MAGLVNCHYFIVKFKYSEEKIEVNEIIFFYFFSLDKTFVLSQTINSSLFHPQSADKQSLKLLYLSKLWNI